MNSTPHLKDYPLRSLARITLQLLSPLHVGTGRGEDDADAGFVRDANGLPLIPGSSIAGKLRRLTNHADAQIPSSFGHQKRDEGLGSRLIVSNAVIHDSQDRPRDGIVPQIEIEGDPVLRASLHGSLRDHVRLSDQGVAAVRGKFDDVSVSAGHRFTFELEFIHAALREDREFWKALLASVVSPLFRLGGKTRRGFGGVNVERIQAASLDLRDKQKEFPAYAAHPAALSDPALALKPQPSAAPDGAKLANLTLSLSPQDFWMFGGGTDADADAAPVRDRRIEWSGPAGTQSGRDVTRWVIPFSGVKGALSHRTLFHACAAAGAWAGEQGDALTQAAADHESVFGCIKGDDSGMPGALYGDDVWLGEAPADLPADRLQHHVAIDRLTGGASDSKLFFDKPLWRDSEAAGVLTIPLHLDNFRPVSAAGRAALKKSLADLCEGRLALGGLTGRGYGRFTSQPSAA